MPIHTVAGGNSPAWSLTFKNCDNSFFNLTAATYTSAALLDVSAVAGGAGLVTTGVFATVSAAAGTATFTPSAADVATFGDYIFEVKITKGGLVYYFRCPVTVLARLTQ